jgi:hypothetical protein
MNFLWAAGSENAIAWIKVNIPNSTCVLQENHSMFWTQRNLMPL